VIGDWRATSRRPQSLIFSHQSPPLRGHRAKHRRSAAPG